MLELLVSKKYAECNRPRVKRTSGARNLTISFSQLSGPKTLKLPDLNIVFYTISFRNEPGRKFLKQSEGQKLLNSRGPAPDCFSAFPVDERADGRRTGGRAGKKVHQTVIF